MLRRKGLKGFKGFIASYEKDSSQKVNYDKSLFYFGANVFESDRVVVASLLGVRVATNSENYLSLPMMVGQSKSQAFAHFLDRFRHKIDSWNLRFLSASGKEVMIKSARQALSIYSMQVILFPESLCSQLDKLLNNFW